MAVKRQTENQKLYSKELARIKRFVARAEKRGYRFSADVVPKKPSKITKKAIQALKDLTPTKLYEQSLYYDTEKDVIISGLEGRKLERSAAARKGHETRRGKRPQRPPERGYQPVNISVVILHNTLDLISRWQPEYSWREWHQKRNTHFKNVLERAFTGAIERDGENTVALRCELSHEDIYESCKAILYAGSTVKETQLQQETGRVVQIINGKILTPEELDELQQDEGYSI